MTDAPAASSDPSHEERPTALVVVDHGSRRLESNAMHEAFVATLTDELDGYVAIVPAHMELAEPTVADAVTTAVAAGARRVLVMPYFLFPGRHWEADIPALVAAAGEAHPGIEMCVTAPVGLHPLMRSVVRERVEQCVRHAEGTGPDCELCAGTDRCQWATS